MNVKKISPGGNYSDIAGMDPSANWLLGPGLDDYLPDAGNTLIPFIITLNDNEGLELVKQSVASGSLFVSSIHRKEMDTEKSFPAFAPKSFFDALVHKEGPHAGLYAAEKEIKLCLPLPSSQPDWKPGESIRTLADPPLAGEEHDWPDDTVVIGIIDDGIAFAHDRFRDADGKSRVYYYWRQDGPHRSASVEFGTEISKFDGLDGAPGIDSLLQQCTVGGAVDEEELYRRAGLIDFAEPNHKSAAWRASHGTHILDIAAGEDPETGITNRPIICAQLDPAAVEDTTLASLEDKIIRAVDYILERAALLSGGEPLPVVINFSFGNIAGPHDGTSYLERRIAQRLQANRDTLRVVLPSGNSHLSRCHAEVAFAGTNDVVELHWRVPPDDATASVMEVWLPHQGPKVPGSERVRLSVESPEGIETPLLGETHSAGVHLLNGSETICAAEYCFLPSPTERGVFVIHLQPTARSHPTAPPLADRIAPPGLWTIRLHNVSLGETERVHAWIQRDDRVYGYPRRGRQSYFDQDCYVRFDSKGREIEDDDHPAQHACEVKRKSLINAIATGEEVIVAGAFLRRELRATKYSAGGPVTPPRGGQLNDDFRKPDALLVGDDSKVHAGVLASGSRSGSTVAFSGTSVAAPQLARWIARKLGEARALGDPPGADRNAVKEEAQAREENYPDDRPALPPNERGGWGRIECPPVVPLLRCLSEFSNSP